MVKNDNDYKKERELYVEREPYVATTGDKQAITAKLSSSQYGSIRELAIAMQWDRQDLADAIKTMVLEGKVSKAFGWIQVI
jgi:hypothetical protein|tara:strand:- start:1423 stop:1665 length:243 start_codon:yes stop_codon:yes gene_type:complete